MDLNLIVLCGRLAVEPELKEFDSGSRLVRLLVTVRSDEPRRRVDVVPVTLWDPPQDLLEDGPLPFGKLLLLHEMDEQLLARAAEDAAHQIAQ